MCVGALEGSTTVQIGCRCPGTHRTAPNRANEKRESKQNISLTFGRQRGLLDDGLGARRGDGRRLLRPGEAGRPSLEHARAPSAPHGGELQDAGPEQHRGGGARDPELHPRPRCGGGRGEPEPAAGEGPTPRMRFPPHQSWTDAPRG
jgi:hypothetical protein